MNLKYEHIMSLEPKEMRKFITSIRNLETALGSPIRKMTDEEKQKRMAVRRSVYLTQNVKKGQFLRYISVDFRRPGFGMSPDTYEKYLNYVFVDDFPAGKQLNWSDLKKSHKHTTEFPV